MQVNLRVKEGGWGDGPLSKIEIIEVVARSVICAFTAGLPSDARFDILLAQNEQPRALKAPGQLGEYVIHIAGPANDWFKLTYELGHEFTHVMADAWSWEEKDPFGWFEEVLADAGSLFALRGLAASWHAQPSRPDWVVNHENFERYSDKYLAGAGRSLDDGVDFKQWLTRELPSFRVEHEQRQRFTIVARHLLPIFERDPTAWRAIQYLHQFERPAGMDFAGFLKGWHDACPSESQGNVDQMAAVLGVSYPAPRARRRTHRATAMLAALRAAVSRPALASQRRSGPPRPTLRTTRPGSSTE